MRLRLTLGLGAGAIDIALNNYVALHYSAIHMSFLHCFYGVGVSASPYIIYQKLLDHKETGAPGTKLPPVFNLQFYYYCSHITLWAKLRFRYVLFCTPCIRSFFSLQWSGSQESKKSAVCL